MSHPALQSRVAAGASAPASTFLRLFPRPPRLRPAADPTLPWASLSQAHRLLHPRRRRTLRGPLALSPGVFTLKATKLFGDDDIKDGGEHGDLAIHTWPPDPGFQVVPGTVHYQITWSQGKEGVDQDWWFSRNLSTPNQAVLAFSTEHHRFGTSGKIHFKIQFTEEKATTVSTTATIGPTELPFGSSKVFEVPPGANWKGTLDLFNGKSFDFAGPFINDYVRVGVAGNMITVHAIP